MLAAASCAAPAPPLPPLEAPRRALDTFTMRDAAMGCAEIGREWDAVADESDWTPAQRQARRDTLAELARAKACPLSGSAE